MYATLTSTGDGDPDDLAQTMSRYSPPDNEAPAVVAASGVVGRSADAAVLLTGLTRFSRGLRIDLGLRRRLDPEPRAGFYEMADAGLLVGVELADGRSVVPRNDVWMQPAAPDEPTLMQNGGGGGGREWAVQLWLTPLPPAGDLVIVAHPGLGVEESRLTVDAADLAAAADRVEVLWPREPDRAQPAIEPVPRELPPGGWFEAAYAPRANRPSADADADADADPDPVTS